jgi:aspartate/methionine/tyrosine aminotransferase
MIDHDISSIRIAIREIQEMAEGCIRFDIGQPDFKTPENVKQAAKKAIDEDKIFYTPTRGLPELRKVIAEYESKKGRSYGENNVVVTDGGMGALSDFFLSLVPKTEVIITKPYFPPYMAMMAIFRCKPVICDLDEIESKISGKTSSILINSPRNPDGVVFDEDQLKKVAEIAESRDLYVISDEVYDRFVYDGGFHSISKFYDKSFIVNSLSKSYAMTGFRVGWLLGPEEELKHIAKINGTINASVNSISQIAAYEALTGPQDSVDIMKKEYKSRRDLIKKRMDEMGWEYPDPRGAFYVFPKINKDSWETATRMIKEAKVSTVPGVAFGCEGYLRLCYGSVSREEIDTAFDRIEKFMGKVGVGLI